MPVEPAPCEGRDLKMLLRRCALCSKFSAEDGGAGVWKMDAPGAKLFLALLAPNALLVEFRCTDWNPSARFVPEEERWKSGWLGRPGARDILDPDCERAWFGGNWWEACCMFTTEPVRFIAEEGIGIAVMLFCTGPRVCAECQSRTRREGVARKRRLTCRRTENMPGSAMVMLCYTLAMMLRSNYCSRRY